MTGVLDWKTLMIHISIFHQNMEMWCLPVQLMAGVLGKFEIYFSCVMFLKMFIRFFCDKQLCINHLSDRDSCSFYTGAYECTVGSSLSW